MLKPQFYNQLIYHLSWEWNKEFSRVHVLPKFTLFITVLEGLLLPIARKMQIIELTWQKCTIPLKRAIKNHVGDIQEYWHKCRSIPYSWIGQDNIIKIFKNWSIVDIQCCGSFRCIAKWFRIIFFFRFYSIIGYYKILNIVSYAIQ